jgi:hypothetical protein
LSWIRVPTPPINTWGQAGTDRMSKLRATGVKLPRAEL